jgi:hypothetical protein
VKGNRTIEPSGYRAVGSFCHQVIGSLSDFENEKLVMGDLQIVIGDLHPRFSVIGFTVGISYTENHFWPISNNSFFFYNIPG